MGKITDCMGRELEPIEPQYGSRSWGYEPPIHQFQVQVTVEFDERREAESFPGRLAEWLAAECPRP